MVMPHGAGLALTAVQVSVRRGLEGPRPPPEDVNASSEVKFSKMSSIVVTYNPRISKHAL